jgi:chitin disaccharide deacetylase
VSGVIIINADDLGRSAEINQAIFGTFKGGYCSSATIMPTMPGFEEACSLVHENKLLKNIGLHLTLRDGYPLTERMKKFSAFCNTQGMLANVTVRSPLFLSADEKLALAEEIRAQIARCRAFGLPLTHLDSHYHTHTNFAIAGVVISVAIEQRIPHVRLTRNCGRDVRSIKRGLKVLFNQRLKARKLAGTDYFGSIGDFLYLTRSHGSLEPRRSMEIMVHPVLGANGRIVDRGGEQSIAELVGQIASYKQAVSYAFAHSA